MLRLFHGHILCPEFLLCPEQPFYIGVYPPVAVLPAHVFQEAFNQLRPLFLLFQCQRFPLCLDRALRPAVQGLHIRVGMPVCFQRSVHSPENRFFMGALQDRGQLSLCAPIRIHLVADPVNGRIGIFHMLLVDICNHALNILIGIRHITDHAERLVPSFFRVRKHMPGNTLFHNVRKDTFIQEPFI